MHRLLTVAASMALATPALAFDTILIDGVNDFSAGTEIAGTSGATWYLEHDANNVYLGLEAPDVASGSATQFVTIYLDTDVGGPDGSTTGVVYNTQQPGLPFAADFHFRWKVDNTYTNLLDFNNGTGSWDDDNTSAGNLGIQAFQAGTYVEFAIPRASLGFPQQIEVTGAMINEQGGAEATFFMFPDSNVEGYDADFSQSTLRALTIPTDVPFLPLWALVGLAGGLGVAGTRMVSGDGDAPADRA